MMRDNNARDVEMRSESRKIEFRVGLGRSFKAALLGWGEPSSVPPINHHHARKLSLKFVVVKLLFFPTQS